MICLDLLGQLVAPVIVMGEWGSTYMRFSSLLKVKNTTIPPSVPLPTYLCHLSPVNHLTHCHFAFRSASLPFKSSPAQQPLRHTTITYCPSCWLDYFSLSNSKDVVLYKTNFSGNCSWLRHDEYQLLPQPESTWDMHPQENLFFLSIFFFLFFSFVVFVFVFVFNK